MFWAPWAIQWNWIASLPGPEIADDPTGLVDPHGRKVTATEDIAQNRQRFVDATLLLKAGNR